MFFRATQPQRWISVVFHCWIRKDSWWHVYLTMASNIWERRASTITNRFFNESWQKIRPIQILNFFYRYTGFFYIPSTDLLQIFLAQHQYFLQNSYRSVKDMWKKSTVCKKIYRICIGRSFFQEDLKKSVTNRRISTWTYMPSWTAHVFQYSSGFLFFKAFNMRFHDL